TCNKGGGTIYDIEEIKQIKQLCEEKNLKLHLDGARVFNAIVESNYSANKIGNQFDTISVCLSKGLGAPIGSLLLGTKNDIKRARRIRKILGGGMRQAGYLAAAGIYALDNNVSRLQEDHKRAKKIASELNSISYIKNVWEVYTNILIFELNHDVEIQNYITMLNKKGLKVAAFGPQQIRIVTHLDFNDEMLTESVNILKKINL
ncbi:MAG: threonine aldolase, partial [Flavobacteriales bacterium]|nr:threonine aldolase [Flavobacteriales bacterium]